MAIPTYDAKPVEPVAKKSTGYSPVGDALSHIGSIGKSVAASSSAVNSLIKNQDSNNLWARTSETMDGLMRKNAELTKKYQDAPNADAMNQELAEYFHNIVASSHSGLAEQSLNDYNKSVLATFDKLRRNNMSWSEKQAEKMAKQNAANAIQSARSLGNAAAYQAGLNGSNIPVTDNIIVGVGGQKKAAKDGVELPAEGAIEEVPLVDFVSMTPQQKAATRERMQSYYLGALKGMPGVDLSTAEGTVVTGENEDGTYNEVPMSAYLEDELYSREESIMQDLSDGRISEEDASKKLANVRQKAMGGAENIGKTRLQVAEERIDEYYDQLKKNIERDPSLTRAIKNDLKNKADLERDDKKDAFAKDEILWKAQNALDLVTEPSMIALDQMLTDTFRGETYLQQAFSGDEEERNKAAAEQAGGSFQINPSIEIEPTQLMDTDINKAFSLAMTNPGGWSDSYLELMKELPRGDWKIEDLQKKYNPDGTALGQEILQTVIALAPNLNVEYGVDWKNAEQGGGFDETAWAYDSMQIIREMPEENNKDKAAKTFAILTMYSQMDHVANNGLGVIDENLKDVIKDFLSDGSFYSSPLKKLSEDQNALLSTGMGRTMYEMVARADEIAQQMDIKTIANKSFGSKVDLDEVFVRSALMNPFFNPNKLTDKQKEIYVNQTTRERRRANTLKEQLNAGLKEANSILKNGGTPQEAMNALEETRFKMNCVKWSPYMDLRKLEEDKRMGRQPTFTHNGTVFIYEGNAGSDVYVRLGDKQMVLNNPV